MKKHLKYKLTEKYRYKHPLLRGINYKNEWCRIYRGVLTVNPEYAWDGCSHKFEVLGFLVGTPDGFRVDENTQCVNLRNGKSGWAKTGKSSLVHDVLCQFRYEIPRTQKQVTQIFDDMLREVGWPLRRPYVWAVDNLGPQDFMI